MSFYAVGSGLEVVQGRQRLNILVFLSTVAQAEFMQIRKELEIGDGQLSQQLAKLEEAGLISISRILEGTRTRTTVTLTTAGMEALTTYMRSVKKLLSQVPSGRAHAAPESSVPAEKEVNTD